MRSSYSAFPQLLLDRTPPARAALVLLWRLREIERELLEIAARARVSTADHAAALMAELQRIERVMRGRNLSRR
jgi:hypothetical protein